jgi:hypothetical protein
MLGSLPSEELPGRGVRVRFMAATNPFWCTGNAACFAWACPGETFKNW